MSNDFIKMMLGANRKKTPLVILAQETELLFLEKRLDSIRDAHKKEHDEICAKYEAQSKEAWDAINKHLLDKGLIKHSDEDLEFDNGVLYKVEDENE